MEIAEKFHPQYITDAQGRQTGVILPVEEYTELLEDLEDLATAAERADEATVPHAQVIKELKADGLLPS